MEYDADLHKAEPTTFGRWSGVIYGDKKGRFMDGTYVFTSRVNQTIKDGEYKYLVTKNSVYRLID